MINHVINHCFARLL